MATYTAVIERDDNDSWYAHLVEDRRCHSWGRTLARTREHMREAVALWFEVEADSFELREEVRLPRTLERSIETMARARSKAEDAATRAELETRSSAKLLVQVGGIGLRDAGELIGLSHQRVQQILAASEAQMPYRLPDARDQLSVAEDQATYDAGSPPRQVKQRRR